MKKIPYQKLVTLSRFNIRTVSYNDLTAKASPSETFKLTPQEMWRILHPYFQSKTFEQLKSVFPLALYLALFQILILRQPVADAAQITAGLAAVIVGLMFFMEGLRLGLMPFGEVIGNQLPKKSKLPTVLGVAFLLGVGCTFAEPAIGALKAAGSNVSVADAPYLYALLNLWTGSLVLVVGAGVGLAAVLGTLRFLYGWSLKPMIYLTLLPTLFLTLFAMQDAELSKMVGLAWDSGAVTTGPVTVPLVLALGIGIASAAGSGNQSLSGFGIVTLASLFPIIGVLVLAIVIQQGYSVEEVIALSQSLQQSAPAWYEQTPFAEAIAGIRAIVPLILFLALVLWLILKTPLPNAKIVWVGIIFAVVGMILFNLGLTYGLAKLGGQAGGMIPAAFAPMPDIEGSPLYWFTLGVGIALVFAFVLGFGATLAEPALNALGMTVETLTNGAFKKSMLMVAVSLGVGLGIATGVAKIIFDLPLGWILIPAYLAAIALTALSEEAYVNVAWDSAGVTTGPVTVPLVLAMGLGLGSAVGASDGFGILSMASIGPIITVLLTGLWVTRQSRLSEKETSEV
jgi:hypothetical protein